MVGLRSQQSIPSFYLAVRVGRPSKVVESARHEVGRSESVGSVSSVEGIGAQQAGVEEEGLNGDRAEPKGESGGGRSSHCHVQVDLIAGQRGIQAGNGAPYFEVSDVKGAVASSGLLVKLPVD